MRRLFIESLIFSREIKQDLTADQKKEIRELAKILKKEAVSRVRKTKR